MIFLHQDRIFYSLALILQVLHSTCQNSDDGGNIDEKKRSTLCGEEKCRAPVIKSTAKNFTVTLGEKKIIRCRAQGNPLPTITWEKNGMRIDTANRNYRISSNNISKKGRVRSVRSQLEISDTYEKEEIYYTCRATNDNGSVQSRKSYMKIVTKHSLVDPKNIPGSSTFVKPMKHNECLPFSNDSVCSQYLDLSRTIFSPNGIAHVQIQERSLKELADKLVIYFSEKCIPYALPFLCYHTFGYCDMQTKKPKKVNLCKRDCVQISQKKCRDEFSKAKQHETLRALIPASCHDFPTSNCMTIDMKEANRPKNKKTDGYLNPWEKIPIDKPSTLKQLVENRQIAKMIANPGDKCYADDGRNFRGVHNRSDSNSLCMYWVNTAEGKKYGTLLSGHNFCRNIDGSRDKPWCYVIKNGAQKMEYCDIPTCAIPLRSETTNILYTIIPCLIFALIVSLAIITLAWRRHKQHYYDTAPTPPKDVVPRVNPKIEELNREDLCDFRLIGDGNIGRIYTADFTGSQNGQTFTTCVAVKSIIEKATQKQIEDFVREAETRSNFKHDNILSLIGVISKEEPLSLIYEYFEYGDLHEYLLKHSPNFSDAHADGECEPLEYSDLLVIASQIANGMAYLSSHGFIHKDLAARNCLVADNGIIKITDICGLSDMYASDYYRSPGRQPIPVRWMSPECIIHSAYSTASDVWSYGILLWEIFSYGSRPYFGLSNIQAMQCICEFEYLAIPDGCPLSIFAVMEKCWSTDPKYRPSFPEIYNQLKCINEKSLSKTNSATSPATHDVSLHSLRSSLSANHREVTPGAPSTLHSNNRNSFSSGSHIHSNSRQSSVPSVNSQHRGSMQSHISIPHSITSMSLSMPPSKVNEKGASPICHGRVHHLQNGVCHNERMPMGYSSDGHYSLSRDTHYSYDPYCISAESQHLLHKPMHAGDCHDAASYVSCLQSYPPSLNCPPSSSVFSRQSSNTPSGVRTIHEKQALMNGNSVAGRSCDGLMSSSSHTYL